MKIDVIERITLTEEECSCLNNAVDILNSIYLESTEELEKLADTAMISINRILTLNIG